MGIPLGGSPCPLFGDQIGIWNVVFFVEGKKQDGPRKKPSEQGWEPATKSTYMWRQVRESNPGHNLWARGNFYLVC